MELDIAMRKILLAALFAFAPSLAFAQCTGVFPPNTLCGNLSGSPAPPSAFSASGNVVGPGSSTINDFALWNNTGGTQLKDAGFTTGTSGHAVPFLDGTNVWSGGATFSSTLTANGTVSGTGITSLFASPPSIGNTAAASGAFTTLSATGASTLAGVTASGNAIIGGGGPWVDVKSGANGCAAAVGNNSNDDTGAIGCQITFMNATFGGGTVFFPCGTYKVTAVGGAPIAVPGGVRLQGAGRTCAVVAVGNNDVQVLTFTGGGTSYGGMRDIWIVGDQAGGALTKNAVVVNAGSPVIFTNCMIWGGNFALQADGVDGSFTDCFIMGTGSSGGGITSVGANWYQRIKMDTIGVTVAVGYKQGASTSVQENHFVNCDFSGSFSANSVQIADTNNHAITTFTNSVFSNAISITGGQYTMFVGDEFGAAVASSVNESVVGSFGLSALTFTGAGTRNCAGNGSITC
jgi:hypothetical protein